MSNLKPEINTRGNWLIVAGIALVVGLVFVAPFISLIALAALAAFLFLPLYQRLVKKMAPGFAATLTLIASVLVIGIPLFVVFVISVIQISQLAALVTGFFDGQPPSSIPTIIQDSVAAINVALAPFVGTEVAVSVQAVSDFIRNTLPEVLLAFTRFLTGFIGGIPIAIILTIMYIILFCEFLMYHKQIKKNMIALSPFSEKVTETYLQRIGLMANAMAKGQLLISLIISVLSAIILTVFLGLGDYFFLMVIVFTVLNLIPLGCGILVIPITIIAMLSGMWIPGLIALVLYILVSNLDAVIRPRIIPKTITLSAGLTMLSAFAGIGAFGLLGVIYGPILMIILVTSVEMYLATTKSTVRADS